MQQRVRFTGGHDLLQESAMRTRVGIPAGGGTAVHAPVHGKAKIAGPNSSSDRDNNISMG